MASYSLIPLGKKNNKQKKQNDHEYLETLDKEL